MTPINTSMGPREWLMLTLLSTLFGGSFFFVGVAVAELPPLTIVTLRVGLAAIVLWGFVLASGLRMPKNRKAWTAFFGMGVLNNLIPFTLIVWGQTQIASGLAAILNATAPLFAVLVASLLLADERATPKKLLGVAVGFSGVVVLIGVPTLSVGNSVPAQIAVLAAALSYALAGVYGRRFRAMALDPTTAAAGQVIASTLILIPLTLVVDGPTNLSAVSWGTWGAIIALAVLSTAIANILYFKILESAGATNLLLVALLIPVSALLLGWLFLNEVVEPVHLIGMAVIAIGLSVIDGRIWKLTGAKKSSVGKPTVAAKGPTGK